MFSVRWKKSARDELASLWLAADSSTRKEITQATHQIDKDLRSNPSSKGESRPGRRRVYFVPPLAVLFRVDKSHSIVRVLQVWRYFT